MQLPFLPSLYNKGGKDSDAVSNHQKQTIQTSPWIDAYFEHSHDGVHWTRLVNDFHQGVFKHMTATGMSTIRINKFARYIRVAWELGGTDPVITFEIKGLAK